MGKLAKLLLVGLMVLPPAGALAADRALSDAGPLRTDDQPYDVRSGQAPATRDAGLRRGQRRLRNDLGRGGIVRADARTGTPRLVIRRNGFLTASRRGRARDLARAYLRSNSAAFGLDEGDVEGLRVEREQELVAGLRRVQFSQVADGIESLDTGVRVTVDARGRLISVSGAPRPDLAEDADGRPRLSAQQALRRALNAAGSRRAAGPDDTAELKWFVTADEVRLAWQVLAFVDSTHVYDTVIDAADGRVLRSRNLTHSATGLAWDNYPTAGALGGTQQSRDFTAAGWLSATDKLQGPNTWVYADINDNINDPDSVPDSGALGDAVQIRPDAGNWNFTQTGFGTGMGGTCPATNACSWDNGVASSWETNRRQNGTQVFYFLNNFHDHLENAEGIKFNNAAGNFEGTDRIHAQTVDGANTASGQPDSDHVNNANMLTLPDGNPPLMQMYLWEGGPPHDVNGGDDAGIVYHEYTHGLNSRLYCCDASGFDLLVGAQPGALHEAWADWYAFDYLNANGFLPDSAAPGEVGFSPYEGINVRRQPADCPPGGGGGACPGSPSASACDGPIPGVPAAGPGGFTYGDFGRICPVDDDSNNIPDGEVHADGEIWASTLWDLRSALVAAHGQGAGVSRARALVTTSMLVGPANPTFLEVRDAMLSANTALGFGADDCTRIWNAFAARGMGSNASAANENDTRPVEGFANPAPGACAAAPPPPPPPPPPLLRPGAASLRGAKSSIRVSRTGRFSYSFRAGARLAGSSLFRTRRRVELSRRGHLTAARKSFRVPSNGRVTLRLKLSRTNLRRLRRNRRFPLRVTITVRNAAGSATARKNLTLLAPRRR